MTNNTDPVRALIEHWRGKAYPITGTAALRLAECADELEAALASAPPAEAQAQGGGEVACRECGQPTMHLGTVCYACSHPVAAPPSAPVGVDYAKRLATSLWQRHYREDAPQWEPFDDLPGLLSQIDNMVSGLTRAPALAQNGRSFAP